MSLYERIAAQPNGARELAAARLRRQVLVLLWQAAAQDEDRVRRMPRRHRRMFAGNGGDVQVDALAEVLHDLGYELEIRLVPAGEPRRKVLAQANVPPTTLSP